MPSEGMTRERGLLPHVTSGARLGKESSLRVVHMPRKTKIVNMSVDESLYEDVDRLAREKGTSRSYVLKEALRQYVASETRWSKALAWGEDSGAKVGVASEADVEAAETEPEKLAEQWDLALREALTKAAFPGG